MIAFLEGDTQTMKQQTAWAADKPPNHGLLGLNASTAAYAGRLRSAEELFQQAEDSARRYGRKESAAQAQAFTALIEAEFGRPDEARQLARASLNAVKSPEIETAAALALARSGDATAAEALATELGQRFPSDTLLNGVDLPTIHAAAELSRGNATAAVHILQAALPYDLSKGVHESALYAPYLRGQAYLRAGDAKAAEVEFQKVLDHRGLVNGSPHGALAHLGLARARRLAGDLRGRRSAYQDFLALWKDADTEIPVLQQARAEYASLR
jgi:ATP/maltotriose-dependent transcriptional regulator MalT